MTMYIQLDQGKETTVDDIDYRYLNQWTWFLKDGYAARPSNDEDGTWIFMHEVILDRMESRPKCSQCNGIGTMCKCVTPIFCIEKGHSVDCTVEEYIDDKDTDTEIFLKCTETEKCFNYSEGNCSFC